MTDFTSEKDYEFIQQHCIETGIEYIPGMSIDVYWNDYHGDESPRDWHHNSTFITWEVDGDSPDKNPYFPPSLLQNPQNTIDTLKQDKTHSLIYFCNFSVTVFILFY